MVITQNTSKFAGGKEMKKSFADIIRKQYEKPQSAKELTENTARKLGFKLKG